MPSSRIGLLEQARARLKSSVDGERVMTLNRGIFCAVMATYVWVIEGPQSSFAPSFLVFGLFLTFGILAHIIKSPRAHNSRRLFAIAVDVGAICLVMHKGNETTAVFFPLILWVMCGNGFRFGLPGLWASTALGLLGFSTMAATTNFWKESLSLTAGLIIGLVILPAYVSILIRKLYQAKARAEDANQAKTEFLTNVSHELRTPLQAIVGAGNLLARTQTNQEQTGLFQTLNEASNILLSMIDGLLKFSSIERGAIVHDVREFNVLELLNEVKRVAGAACKAKGLTVSIHIEVSVPLVVKGGRDLIRDVLLSLAGNAVRFTSEGGVLLTVSNTEKTTTGKSLTFEVIDTGVGVPPEIQEKVFDRFYTSASASNPGSGGTGIGLAICKGLVQALGGEIGLHRGQSHGAAFWFRVPVEVGVATPHRSMSPQPAAALFMPYNIPKGRLLNMLFEQRRRVEDTGSPNCTFSDFLTTARNEPRTMLVATPRSDAAYSAMSKMLKHADRDSHVPVILVDEVGQTVPTQDLRRLAPLRLRGNFTDQEMGRALEIADLLAADTTESDITEQSAIAGQLRILIVDDNKTNRTIFAKMVECAGHTCDLAASGDEALDALEHKDFSLVLMDVNMPGTDGLEATKLQRLAESGLARTPIIGITADASPALAEKCHQAGMDGCLVKPITIATMKEALGRFCTSSAQTNKPASNVVNLREPPIEAEVDNSLILSLKGIGGTEFVQEVLSDFGRDVTSLVDDLGLALARTDVANCRFIGHALASAAANIGAIRVRKLGLEIENASDLKLQAEGYEMVKAIRYAIAGFINLMRNDAI